jgi:hypothetical protein
MNTCVHTWLYIGSKRQKIWRCTLCDEYRIDDPTPKRKWQGLTDEEIHIIIRDSPLSIIRAIEAKLKEKNT